MRGCAHERGLDVGGARELRAVVAAAGAAAGRAWLGMPPPGATGQSIEPVPWQALASRSQVAPIEGGALHRVSTASAHLGLVHITAADRQVDAATHGWRWRSRRDTLARHVEARTASGVGTGAYSWETSESIPGPRTIQLLRRRRARTTQLLARRR